MTSFVESHAGRHEYQPPSLPHLDGDSAGELRVVMPESTPDYYLDHLVVKQDLARYADIQQHRPLTPTESADERDLWFQYYDYELKMGDECSPGAVESVKSQVEEQSGAPGVAATDILGTVVAELEDKIASGEDSENAKARLQVARALLGLYELQQKELFDPGKKHVQRGLGVAALAGA